MVLSYGCLRQMSGLRQYQKRGKKRGVDPNRLVFANKLPQAEHLARHKHADLFLDTFCYNAHTTASMPYGLVCQLSQKRRMVAARVSVSLLTAVGLPELITKTDADYENLIIELANQPEKLSRYVLNFSLTGLRSLYLLSVTRNFEAGLYRLMICILMVNNQGIFTLKMRIKRSQGLLNGEIRL